MHHHSNTTANYGETITAVKPVLEGDTVVALETHSSDDNGNNIVRRGRNLVLGIGGRPYVPEFFSSISNDRVLHSSAYLKRIEQIKAGLSVSPRIAVIGGGQSAAEIYLNLVNSLPDSQVSMIFRSGSLKPADSSPFVNEIFHSHFTNVVYAQAEEDRKQHLMDYQDTNYAVVDEEELAALQELFYNQKLRGEEQHRMYNNTNVIEAREEGNQVTLLLEDKFAGEHRTEKFDLVITATGYKRDVHKKALASLEEYFDDYRVDRNYRLQTHDNFLPGIYLQGYCEDSHGLSDTLLSVLAVRSEEILTSLVTHTDRQPEPEAVS